MRHVWPYAVLGAVLVLLVAALIITSNNDETELLPQFLHIKEDAKESANKVDIVPTTIKDSPYEPSITKEKEFEDVRRAFEQNSALETQLFFSINLNGRKAVLEGLVDSTINEKEIRIKIEEDKQVYFINAKLSNEEKVQASLRQGYKVRINGTLIGVSGTRDKTIFVSDAKIVDIVVFTTDEIFADSLAVGKRNGIWISIDKIYFDGKDSKFGSLNGLDVTLYNEDYPKFRPIFSVFLSVEGDPLSSIKEVAQSSIEVERGGYVRAHLNLSKFEFGRLNVTRIIEVDIMDQADIEKNIISFVTRKVIFG